METTTKIYTGLVEFSILIFTLLFAWFTFVYYPNIVADYQTGHYSKKLTLAPVTLARSQFPIMTNAYRVDFETASNTYFVFVRGSTLDQYLTNHNGANLALKTLLSRETLCDLSIVYVSTANLQIPERFKNNGECK